MPPTEPTKKTITKKILLQPGGFYEFRVKAPQVLEIHAFDETVTLQPGDEFHMIVTAPPPPTLPKSVALPVPPNEERKVA